MSCSVKIVGGRSNCSFSWSQPCCTSGRTEQPPDLRRNRNKFDWSLGRQFERIFLLFIKKQRFRQINRWDRNRIHTLTQIKLTITCIYITQNYLSDTIQYMRGQADQGTNAKCSNDNGNCWRSKEWRERTGIKYSDFKIRNSEKIPADCTIIKKEKNRQLDVRYQQ